MLRQKDGEWITMMDLLKNYHVNIQVLEHFIEYLSSSSMNTPDKVIDFQIQIRKEFKTLVNTYGPSLVPDAITFTKEEYLESALIDHIKNGGTEQNFDEKQAAEEYEFLLNSGLYTLYNKLALKDVVTSEKS